MASSSSSTFSSSSFVISDVGDYLTLMLSVYMVVCLTVSLAIKCFPKMVLSRKRLENPKRILLVIAHPDDECLFFGPTVLALLRNARRHFYVMCLSTGDFEGKGQIRKQELWESCGAMGILPENVILIKHDHLRDDPKANWSADLVGRIVLSHVMSHQIDTLITFDSYGVSGHRNHGAIYYAVLELVKQGKIPSFCTAYALESVNIIRKYSPTLFDLPLCFLSSSVIYVTQGYDNAKLLEAMKQHYSQTVWFRRLYLIFSRYLTVNTLRPISATQFSKPVK